MELESLEQHTPKGLLFSATCTPFYTSPTLKGNSQGCVFKGLELNQPPCRDAEAFHSSPLLGPFSINLRVIPTYSLLFILTDPALKKPKHVKPRRVWEKA